MPPRDSTKPPPPEDLDRAATRAWPAPSIGENQPPEDPEEFARWVYEHHGAFLHQTLVRRWKIGPASAEDLQQDLMVKLFLHHQGQTLPEVEKLRAFMQGIMKHEAIDHLRRRRVLLTPDGQVDLSVDLDADAEPPPGIPLDPERMAMLLEHRAKARRYMGLLTRPEQDVVRAIDLQDMSALEAAAALGLPLGTVSTRHRRARRRLDDMAEASRRATERGERRRGAA
jgi:RNA polymerase sigma-70 factor (ECF subfamily)